MKRVSLPNYISKTGAGFDTRENFVKSTTVVDSTASTLESAGIPLMRVDNNTYATSNEELHCFIIGDSGCGKTRRVILPSIHLLAKAGESMIISDPKGELYKYTSKMLRNKGYSVRVLNFRSPSRGDRWNPLGIIEEFYRKGDIDSKDKAISMLNDIIAVLQKGIKSESDPYWSKCAGDVFRGVVLAILEFSEPGELTFDNIAVTAREMLIEENQNKRFAEFISSLPKNSPIVQNLSCVITNSSNTRNCIISEFEALISMYCNVESLKDLFAASEIDINMLGRAPTALFFILPDDTEAMYPIATVFIKQVYSSLISLADEQPNGKLPNRVTFLLDEFANFATLPSVQSMLTAARSRKIRFVLVCQSMEQLTEKYKETGRETLLANCRTWIYMSCRNLPFLKRLQDLLGSYISPYTQSSFPLVDLSELQQFKMGQVLVLNDRSKPMMGFLPDYDTYDFGDDGHGSISELPSPHVPIRKKYTDIYAVYRKAEAVHVPSNTDKVKTIRQKIQAATDHSVRDSLFAMYGDPSNPNNESEDNPAEDDGSSSVD